MSVPESKYLSAVWRDDIFSEHSLPPLVIFLLGGE